MATKPATKKPAAKTPGRPGFGGPRAPLTKAQQRERAAQRAERLKHVTFEAPEGFRTQTYAVKFGTQHDGTIHPGAFRMLSIKGKWDNPEARTFDLSLYDPATIQGMMSRLSALFYHGKADRRLPPKMVFYVVVAVRSDKDGNIGMSLREFAYDKKIEKNGKKVNKRIVVTRDPVKLRAKEGPQVLLARLKRGLKFLRGAFVVAQPQPSISEYKAMTKAALGDGEEE